MELRALVPREGRGGAGGEAVAAGACLSVAGGPAGCELFLTPLCGVSEMATALATATGQRLPAAASGGAVRPAAPSTLMRGLTGEVDVGSVGGVVQALLGRTLLSALAATADALGLQNYR